MTGSAHRTNQGTAVSPWLLAWGPALAARGGEAAARERLEAARVTGEQLGAGLCVEKANEALIGLSERPVALQEEEG